MNVVRARLHVAEDGTITGFAPRVLSAGDHEADILAQPALAGPSPNDADLWATIRALQDEVARLPVLNPGSPEEILGYTASGAFD